MEILTFQIAGLLITALVLVLTGVWSAHHGGVRLLMVSLFAVLIGLIFTGSSGLLGRAKPVALEWLKPKIEEATILSGHLMEDKGIFLTLVWNDEEPRLYVLPWNQELAEQLQQALRQAEQNDSRPVMRRPFESGQDREEPVFYAPPQPKLPEKTEPQQGLRLD